MKTAQQNIRIEEGFIGQKMIILPARSKRILMHNPVACSLYPTAIGYFPKAFHHDITRKNGSGEYIFMYCVEGCGEISFAGQTWTLTQNTWFILPKHKPHAYHSDGAHPWSMYWVHFDGGIAAHLYDRSLQNGHNRVQSMPFHEKTIACFEDLYSIFEHGRHEREPERTHVSLLYFLARFVYEDYALPAVHGHEPVAAAIAVMKENLTGKFNIDNLAAGQHMSVSHFCRLFRQKTGYSPINYFNHLKIQRAGQYLFFTDMSIKEICRETGFADPYYFSRLFVRMMGSPPSLYRKAYRNKL